MLSLFLQNYGGLLLLIQDSVELVYAERQGAVKSLEYALAAGTDAAAEAKTEVEATLQRTSEQVCFLPVPNLNLVCDKQGCVNPVLQYSCNIWIQ